MAKPLQGGKKGEFRRMLLRECGATRAELLDFTERVGTRWAALSVPQQARWAGLTLTKRKEKGKPTVYFGSIENIPADQEWASWTEGKVREHLRRERQRDPRIVAAKKSEFVREHGKLFCQRCELDPVADYGEAGLACIEVHHNETHVANMEEGHETILADLVVLCANCHRVVHRLLTKTGERNEKVVVGLRCPADAEWVL